jgi:hypothetical protein
LRKSLETGKNWNPGVIVNWNCRNQTTECANETDDVLERRKRKARQHIDEVEEEYEGKRKLILGELKRKLVQEVTNTPLFTLRWRIV